jgi:hypothetical protein
MAYNSISNLLDWLMYSTPLYAAIEILYLVNHLLPGVGIYLFQSFALPIVMFTTVQVSLLGTHRAIDNISYWFEELCMAYNRSWRDLCHVIYLQKQYLYNKQI